MLNADETRRRVELLLAGDQPPVFLLGAGASMPFLPTADALKQATLRLLARGAGIDRPDFEAWCRRISAQDHLTLEVFYALLRYRTEGVFDPVRLWGAVAGDSPISASTRAVALLAQRAGSPAILTTNFDTTAYRALRELSDALLLTELNVADRDARGAGTPLVVALHGTVSSMEEGGEQGASLPTTATARGLARRLSPTMQAIVEELLAGHPLITVGYRGGDHYDLNPLLAAIARGRSADVRRWAWLAHGSRRESVSPFVWQTFEAAIAGCDTGQLLGSLIEQAEQGEGGQHPWAERLAQFLASRDFPPMSIEAFFEDLDRGVPGGWTVLEHYYLHSSGFGDRETRTFAVGAEGDTLLLHRVHLARLLDGIEAYRVDSRAFHSSAAILESIERELALVLGANGTSLRPIERALFLVLRAAALDYLGLIHRKRAPDGTSPDAREARRLFALSEALASEAKKTLSDASEAGMADLVQADTWIMIARENTWRTLPRGEALSGFATMIETRRALTAAALRDRGDGNDASGAGEYLVAHLPQLILRDTEYLKLVLQADGVDDVPTQDSQLDPALRRGYDDALRDLRASVHALTEMFGWTNYRLIAALEVEILHAHASGGDVRRAVDVFEERVEILQPYLDGRTEWVESIRRRGQLLMSTNSR